MRQNFKPNGAFEGWKNANQSLASKYKQLYPQKNKKHAYNTLSDENYQTTVCEFHKCKLRKILKENNVFIKYLNSKLDKKNHIKFTIEFIKLNEDSPWMKWGLNWHSKNRYADLGIRMSIKHLSPTILTNNFAMDKNTGNFSRLYSYIEEHRTISVADFVDNDEREFVGKLRSMFSDIGFEYDYEHKISKRHNILRGIKNGIK